MLEEISKSLISRMEVIPASSLIHSDQKQILELCDRAYNQDLRPLFAIYPNPLHVIIRDSAKVIAHACLIERWLQIADLQPLRTGFVEAVATDPECQGRGLGGAVMKQIISEAERQQFEIGGLSTGRHEFYKNLGWELWAGPLSYRENGEIILCPEESGAMVYRLSRTPALDVTLPLSVEWRAGPEIW